MNPKQIIMGILDVFIALLILALFYYMIDLFVDSPNDYDFYIPIMAGVILVLGPVSVTFIAHGIRLFSIQGGKKKDGKTQTKEPKVIHTMIAAIYFSSPVIGLILVIYGMTPHMSIILEDIGEEITNLLAIILIGGAGIQIYLGLEHAAAIKGKKIVIPMKLIKEQGESRVISPKRRMTTMAHLQTLLISCIIIGGLIIGGLPLLFKPPTCNEYPISFSPPAYDVEPIVASNHTTIVLDNGSLVNQMQLDLLERALWAMTKVQHVGGFPMECEIDGTAMYGDRGEGCPYFEDEFSMQGGTPRIASVYLEMYKLEPNPVYLSVAKAAADALVAVQYEGGFYYDGRRYPDGSGYLPHPRNNRGATVLDDDVTQSCLRYLLDVYNVTGESKYLSAINKGFDQLDAIEVAGGGWPQRSRYTEDEYPSYVTLNDNAMYTTVKLMLKAYDQFNDSRYLDAAKRAGDFLLRVQGNGGSALQQAWAQQYKDDQPAWARAFEPYAFCSSQTARVIDMLIELYLYTNDTKYLNDTTAIEDAITWLNASYLIRNDTGTYGWSRLYELGTNVWIVGNRQSGGEGEDIPYHYDYDEERDEGYSWFGTWGINDTIDNYYHLVNDLNGSIPAYLAERNAPPTAASLNSSAQGAGDKLDADYFWTEYSDGRYIIDDGAFSGNAMKMINFYKAVDREY